MGQEDLGEGPATHQRSRPASGKHTLRVPEGRGQGSRWCHRRRRGLLPTRHRRRDGVAGAGSDQAGEVEVSAGQPGCSPRADRPCPTLGEYRAPLQLMGPGDHPMQRLALMMAVMMLGMPPVNGCSTSVGPGSQGAGDQAEMMFSPSAWFGNSGEALTTEKRISSVTLDGSPPVEPGGFPVCGSCNKSSRGWKAWRR